MQVWCYIHVMEYPLSSTPYRAWGKKTLSSHLGQVDFPVKQATFLAHLPTGKAPDMSHISIQSQRASWILDFFLALP